MKPTTITFFGDTHVGMVRTNNEDAFIARPLWNDGRHALCVAIDGLGGHAAGEVAAEIAQTTIVSYLEAHRDGDCLDLLKNAVTEANNKIVEEQQTSPGRANMGCVLTAGIFDSFEMRLYVAHVGDSRLYFIRGGKIKKLTHDHSLVGYREDIGELTEEQAMSHPQRNVIERNVGEGLHNPDDRNFIEASKYGVQPGSRYVFCSDGLSDLLTSAEIAQLGCSSPDLRECVSRLIKAACDKGGKDNITVVMAQAGSWDDVLAVRSAEEDTVRVHSLEGAPSSSEPGSGTQPPQRQSNKGFRIKSPAKFMASMAALLLLVGGLSYWAGRAAGKEVGKKELQETVKPKIEALQKAIGELEAIADEMLPEQAPPVKGAAKADAATHAKANDSNASNQENTESNP